MANSRMRLALSATLAVFLVACSTFKDIETGLTALKGQHINLLVSKIGYPQRESSVGGRKFYVWEFAQTSYGIVPQVAYHSGTMSSDYGSSSSFYSGTTTTYAPTNFATSCTITVAVDQNEKIFDFRYSGDLFGCMEYSGKLRIKEEIP